VIYYYLGDHVLYLAYKLARRDLYHWVPLEGAAMVAQTLMVRVGIKAITDFTGVVQFRAPGEMGGAAWTFSQGSALVTSFVATHMYLSSGDATSDGEVMSDSRVWTIVGALSGSQIFFFACFLLLMKQELVTTFISFETGHHRVTNRFLTGETDGVKALVFTTNVKLWTGIRCDVKAWTMENWERWEEEKPEWFNDAWKARVEDDMIPPARLREMKMNGSASRRRRSSLGDILGVGAKVTPVAGGGETDPRETDPLTDPPTENEA
jgi:hypothetical protein